jgi:hypothetical protein
VRLIFVPVIDRRMGTEDLAGARRWGIVARCSVVRRATGWNAGSVENTG